MIAIALPDIVRSIGADLGEVTWLVTLYLIAMAALQPVGGKLGDTYGRRRLLLGSLVWFGLASVAAAAATELGWLIGFRLQQALAGAVMIPNAGALVRSTLGDGRGSAFAIIAAATSTGAAAGPVVGGVLVAALGWHATFLVNVPLVVAALALGWWSIPADRVRARGRFDLLGAAALSTILAVAAWTLSRVRTEAATTTALFVAVLGAAGVAFARYERGRENAIFRPDLFRDRTFAAANGAIALGNLAMYATMLAVPLVLAGGRGADAGALGSGVVLSALFVTMFACSPLGGRFADRAGRRWPSVAGYAIFAAGSLALALAPPQLVPAGLVVSGIGLGLSAGGLRAAAVEAVDAGHAGLASGIFSTSRYTGGIVGSLLVSLLLRPTAPDATALHLACAAAAAAASLLCLLLEDWPARSL